MFEKNRGNIGRFGGDDRTDDGIKIIENKHRARASCPYWNCRGTLHVPCFYDCLYVIKWNYKYIEVYSVVRMSICPYREKNIM